MFYILYTVEKHPSKKIQLFSKTLLHSAAHYDIICGVNGNKGFREGEKDKQIEGVRR